MQIDELTYKLNDFFETMTLCIWFNGFLQVLIRNPIIFYTNWNTIQKQTFKMIKIYLEFNEFLQNLMKFNEILLIVQRKYWKLIKINAFLSKWWNSIYNWMNFSKIKWKLNHLPSKMMETHKNPMVFSQTD